MLKAGLINVGVAKTYAARRRARLGKIYCVDNANRRMSIKHIPIRQHPRICIPNVLISRGIRALTAPVRRITDLLWMAGPEMAKRLEQRVARLGGISSPSRLQQIERAVALWLLEAPDSEPEATECSSQDATVSIVDDPELRGLPLETQRQVLADFGIAAKGSPTLVEAFPEALFSPQNQNIQGVR